MKAGAMRLWFSQCLLVVSFGDWVDNGTWEDSGTWRDSAPRCQAYKATVCAPKVALDDDNCAEKDEFACVSAEKCDTAKVDQRGDADCAHAYKQTYCDSTCPEECAKTGLDGAEPTPSTQKCTWLIPDADANRSGNDDDNDSVKHNRNIRFREATTPQSAEVADFAKEQTDKLIAGGEGIMNHQETTVNKSGDPAKDMFPSQNCVAIGLVYDGEFLAKCDNNEATATAYLTALVDWVAENVYWPNFGVNLHLTEALNHSNEEYMKVTSTLGQNDGGLLQSPKDPDAYRSFTLDDYEVLERMRNQFTDYAFRPITYEMDATKRNKFKEIYHTANLWGGIHGHENAGGIAYTGMAYEPGRANFFVLGNMGTECTNHANMKEKNVAVWDKILMAHEIGHLFGGEHTFSSKLSGCNPKMTCVLPEDGKHEGDCKTPEAITKCLDYQNIVSCNSVADGSCEWGLIDKCDDIAGKVGNCRPWGSNGSQATAMSYCDFCIDEVHWVYNDGFTIPDAQAHSYDYIDVKRFHPRNLGAIRTLLQNRQIRGGEICNHDWSSAEERVAPPELPVAPTKNRTEWPCGPEENEADWMKRPDKRAGWSAGGGDLCLAGLGRTGESAQCDTYEKSQCNAGKTNADRQLSFDLRLCCPSKCETCNTSPFKPDAPQLDSCENRPLVLKKYGLNSRYRCSTQDTRVVGGVTKSAYKNGVHIVIPSSYCMGGSSGTKKFQALVFRAMYAACPVKCGFCGTNDAGETFLKEPVVVATTGEIVITGTGTVGRKATNDALEEKMTDDDAASAVLIGDNWKDLMEARCSEDGPNDELILTKEDCDAIDGAKWECKEVDLEDGDGIQGCGGELTSPTNPAKPVETKNCAPGVLHNGECEPEKKESPGATAATGAVLAGGLAAALLLG